MSGRRVGLLIECVQPSCPGGTGTPSGAGRASRLLVPRRRARPAWRDRLLRPGVALAGLGLVLASLLAFLPAPDRPRSELSDASVGPERVHRVRDGENLREISRQYYDDPSQWRRIFAANRDQLLADGRLVAGSELVIPAAEREEKERSRAERR
ncbi:MAG: LysM peptidoglycan-binding domain-containing protein [Planctomycetes bacterium]|nr:LysM peptidoglycan-binding domain-containing protein [Planctomycetota bacterium]